MIDFTVPSDVAAFLDTLQAFIEEEVVPVERELTEEDYRHRPDGSPGRVEAELLPELRHAARLAEVYGPQLPPELGGRGLPPTATALVSERCGPHPLASYAINMMAPDEATMDLLHRFGSAEQQARWLEPLAAGEIRSCFGMTEPDAGSDPRRITSTARPLPNGGWRIDAHKVFTTGAIGAAFCVVMAVSEPEAPPGEGISMFLVPTDTPGFQVVRDLPTMGAQGLGGHPEVRLEGVEVGPGALLGERNRGLAMAQTRLATGRMGHAMRWIGVAQAALDLAARRALERETFGRPLADRQAVQWWLADGATRLYASRLMVLNTLWKAERRLEHRAEVSMVKTYVAETLGEIVDRALQVFGGWGYITDYPLERWYRDARAARIYDGPSEVHRMYVARLLLAEARRTGTTLRTTGDLLAALREEAAAG